MSSSKMRINKKKKEHDTAFFSTAFPTCLTRGPSTVRQAPRTSLRTHAQCLKSASDTASASEILSNLSSATQPHPHRRSFPQESTCGSPRSTQPGTTWMAHRQSWLCESASSSASARSDLLVCRTVCSDFGLGRGLAHSSRPLTCSG